MHRRQILAWLSRACASVTAAIVAVPGVQYLWGSVRSGSPGLEGPRRVARLADLRPGQPLLIPLLGTRQDAWMSHAQEVIGRVWLVRQPTQAHQSSPPAQVKAFTSLCPHMGCQIQLANKQGKQAFVCPCHKANFALDGARAEAPEPGERNHAPRGMDDLECQVVQDKGTGEWWVEVRYQAFVTGMTQKKVRA